MAPASGGQQPEKKKEKRERLKGFAGLLVGQLAALNHIPKFKERFGAVDLKFLLVATDMYPGALVHVDHGEVKISAVPKEECKKWKKTGAQGLLQCSTAQFMDIVMRKLDPVKGWITRKIKIRGPRKLIELSKMLAILSRASKPKAPPATPKV
jgi:putative sterol carrier protein